MVRLLVLLLTLALPLPLQAGDVRLAVASNLLPAAQALGAAFERDGLHRVSIAHGATGRLFTQITRGAPFDIFLSADRERPERLEAAHLSAARRSFARGRLALIGPAGADLDAPMPDLLAGRRVAIADPALAPYGVAAMEVLQGAGVDPASMTLLRAENIGQVAAWLATGNAEFGLLALSLVPGLQQRRAVSVRVLPQAMHGAILQDAVWLRSAADNPAAAAFWDWLAGDDAQAILADHGFERP